MEKDIALFFWNLRETVFFDFFDIISGRLYIGISAALFVVYALYLLKKKALVFLLAAGMALGISDTLCYRVLKPVIKRPRPGIELYLNVKDHDFTGENKSFSAKDYSMPSNHASNIFSFFAVYFLFVRRRWPLLFANALLISLSRIFIVKHYPTDVLAGIAAGIIIGITVFFIISAVYKKVYTLISRSS